MSLVLCSTGAVIGTPNGRDHTIMKRIFPKLSCDGYEFMMYDTWYGKIDTITEFINENKFNIPVMHFDKKIGELISHFAKGELFEAVQRFEKNCDIASKIGAKKAVLHLWGGLDSDRDFLHNINAYSELRAIADAYGVELLIENIVCNNSSPMQRLVELYEKYPSISFIFDTKMAQFHQELELIYDEKYKEIAKRIKHFHINDYNGGYKEWQKFKTLHIEEGVVDFERFFKFIKDIGYDGAFTVEGTSFNKDGIIDTVSLNRDFEYIKNHI